ncbi:hypothetical protein GCM10011508_02490 [Flavobacterium lutivivi]|nr:hypothetical protein GCM10011508_02490 [Flavobacterium lutivivi]
MLNNKVNGQTQLAGWTFDTTSAAPSTPSSVSANLGTQSGSAFVYADGTNGSSTWITATSGNELTTFAGTTTSDPRTTPVAGNAYSILGGTGNSANGKSLVIKFSMTGYENPILTFATRGTGTGFSTHQWSWSTDNVSYTNFGTNTANTGSTFTVKTLDLSAINSVDNVTTVYLKLTVTGATSASGNNRLDNFVINATQLVVLTSPTVTNTTASGITVDSATLAGNVTATGGDAITDNGSVYSTSDTTPTIAEGATQVATPSPGSGTGAFSNNTGSVLSVNTLYYYNAYAINSQGTSYGTSSSFYTLANVPSLPVVNNPTSSTLDVSIGSGDGNPSNTLYAIQVGSSYVQNFGSSTLGVTPVWFTSSQWGTTTVTGLAGSTLYTFSVKAKNGDNVETSFGSSTSLSTSVNSSPYLQADPLTDFGSICINTTTSANSFGLLGEFLTGDITVGPLSGYTFSTILNGTYLNSLTISPDVNDEILETIYVKFTPSAVQSYDGNISISGGGASSINVSATGTGINTPATVTTGSSSSITSTTATISGTVTEGCSSVATSGMEYSLNSDLSGATQVSNPGNLTSLQPNTQYYYRAFAQDGTGTVNGNILSFTTSQLSAPTANAATAIQENQFTANWSAVDGASSYLLDVATTSSFVNTVNLPNLIISEYGEGSTGNKKYIEIFNGTGSTVDLSQYNLKRATNGGGWPTTGTAILNLSGTLANGQTYVVANNSTDVIGANLYNSGIANWNGDDAVGLFNGSTLVDVFGTPDSDPGSGWNIAGVTNASVDHILIRKPSVLAPNTNWTLSAGTNTSDSEWIVSGSTYSATNQTTNLGLHTVNNTSSSYVSGYEALNVGNVTSYNVTGLLPSTTYYYRVRAVSSNSTSANSNVISLTTAAQTPTFTSINQAAGTFCEDTDVTFEVFGLIPNSVSTLYYDINGTNGQADVVVANGTGYATFAVNLPLTSNGLTLTINQVERVDIISPILNVSTNNTVVLAVAANATYYADTDGDGYGDAASTIVSCAGAPVGYVANNTDCDDNDNTKHTTFSFYEDVDGDGVGFGALVSGVCAVDANTPPVGYSLTNTDCAPSDGLAYQMGMFYTDADGDNYSLDNSQVSLCYGATEPNGYSAVSLGIDCNDSVAAINPGLTEILYDGFDNNCNGLLDEGNQLISSMTNCGTTLATISSLISCTSVAGIDGYRFEVTNTATSAVQTIDRPLQYFSLTQLSSFEYATTYSVRVMLRKNGIWLGYYGPSCLYSTPPVTQPTGGTGTTQLQTYCGQTLPSISTIIATTSLPGATGYRFRVTNTTTGSIQTLTRTLHWFSLTMLPSYNYGTTYVVDVAVKTTGDYSEYGAPCNVTTPNVPTLVNYCGGAIVPTKGTYINTSSLDRVTSYRFEVTRYTDETLSTAVDVSQIDRNINWFTFNMVSNYSANTHYGVRVQVMTSGTWSPWSDACEIVSPATARVTESVTSEVFSVKGYPNPYDYEFSLQMESSIDAIVSIKVYDMVGKLIDTREVQPMDVPTVSIGSRYPSGVYNVVVSQGEHTQTLRMVKR